MKSLIIQPRDPVIFRDGKPFSAGLPARSLSFCPPSVIAGALRTRLGSIDGEFDSSRVDALRQDVELSGPLLAYRRHDEAAWKIALPVPADTVAYGTQPTALNWIKLRPVDPVGGCDLPAGLHSLEGAIEEKPAKKAPVFWKWDAMSKWLRGDLPGADVGFNAFHRQRRVHVKVESATQHADEGMLFSTEGLEFGNGSFEFSLACQYAGEGSAFQTLSHIGGEGRTAYWDSSPTLEWPASPPDLDLGKKIRMILATPAIFRKGWKPEWLGDQNRGRPPVPGAPFLELVAAAVPRAVPLSGWDYDARKPKSMRLAVPSGSTYFFNVVDGDPRTLWMQSVCDDPQDRRDGFGRVLIGTGDWPSKQENPK